MNTLWEALGISPEKVKSQYGVLEGVYLRELLRYPGDGSFRVLEEAVRGGRCEEIRQAAHAVKGLWRMLLMDDMAQAAQEIEACARAEDRQGAAERMDGLRLKHEQMVARLVWWQKGGLEDEDCCL
ncbi:MAG: Hpt domain-containing protein [Clostridiales bacterium]|nr:Hpt domain-containing protein [Clostridiales bacterium]